MATDKKTFIFYSDWINMVREMPNEEAGILLKHILSYVNDENPTTDNLLVKMAFAHMKPILKSDLVKWDRIREKRKKAGAKGGKANAKQIQANAKQVEAVNDNVNVISINTYNKDLFLTDWNTIRTEVIKKPSHLSRLNYDLLDLLKGIDRSDCQNALRGFFKQRKFPNDMDYTVNPKHFLNHFDLYLQAYHDKNPNVWGKNE